jgi:hypothetical protein
MILKPLIKNLIFSLSCILFLLLISSLSSAAYGTTDIAEAAISLPGQKIIVLKYSEEQKNENILEYQLENDQIAASNHSFINNVRKVDRYLRYIDADNLILLKIEDNNKHSHCNFYSFLECHDLKTGKKHIKTISYSDSRFSGYRYILKPEDAPYCYITNNCHSLIITSSFIGNVDNIMCKISRIDEKRGKSKLFVDIIGNLFFLNKLSDDGKITNISTLVLGHPDIFSMVDATHENKSIIYRKKFPVNPLESPDFINISFLNSFKNIYSLLIVSQSRTLYEKEILNWKKLITDLKFHSKSKVHYYIWNQLDYDTKNRIIQINDYDNIDENIKNQIVKGLNTFIISKTNILSYSYLHFDRILELLFNDLGAARTITCNPITLNRILIDTAFQDSVAKSSQPELLVSFKPIYRDNESNGIPIPHKCWSPTGDKILFTGALEKEYCANVYTIDINSRKIEKVLDVDDSSGSFNPDLEWNENGMTITCRDGIFVRDVKALESSAGKLVKLPIPQDISDLKNGRISPDGNQLFFFGKKDGSVNMFVYNFADSAMMSEIIGNDPDMENYQGTWIYKDKMSVIKNEMDYIKPENMNW